MELTKCIPNKNHRLDVDGWLIQFPYDRAFLDDFKDAIDQHYREWLPATKTWWVDEECGGMLAGLFENWDMPITQPINTIKIWKKPKCPICNGAGVVPSKVLGKFSGKLIPNCFTDCECREEEPEHYHRVRPEDFGFPMSYDYYRFLCQCYGWPDPGTNISVETQLAPQMIEHVHRHSEMGKKEFDLLTQTARKVGYLESQLRERKPSVKSPKATSYKGIK